MPPPLPEPAAAATLWTAGGEVPIEEAIANALEVDFTSPSSLGPRAVMAAGEAGSPAAVVLTPREHQVLALLCQRRTNAEMSALLYLQSAHGRRPCRASAGQAQRRQSSRCRGPGRTARAHLAGRHPVRVAVPAQSRSQWRSFYAWRAAFVAPSSMEDESVIPAERGASRPSTTASVGTAACPNGTRHRRVPVNCCSCLASRGSSSL
jgi:hypothetical protein